MHTLESLQNAITKIKQIIGYCFANEDLLLQAFVHRSFINEYRCFALQHNERLEFLGDSVLGLAVAQMLYELFPEVSEGVLSQFRSRLVDVSACAFYLEKLGLSEFILLGKGEEKSEGYRKTSILGNVFEALIGAFFLDGGFSAAKTFLQQHFFEDMQQMLESPSQNYKAALQDYSQKKYQKPPVYKICKEEGPDHAKKFFVQVYLQDKMLGEGVGYSKKDAEQQAAKEALEKVCLEKKE